MRPRALIRGGILGPGHGGNEMFAGYSPDQTKETDPTLDRAPWGKRAPAKVVRGDAAETVAKTPLLGDGVSGQDVKLRRRRRSIGAGWRSSTCRDARGSRIRPARSPWVPAEWGSRTAQGPLVNSVPSIQGRYDQPCLRLSRRLRPA